MSDDLDLAILHAKHGVAAGVEVPESERPRWWSFKRVEREPVPAGWTVTVRRWAPRCYDAYCAGPTRTGWSLAGEFRRTALLAHNDMVAEIQAKRSRGA